MARENEKRSSHNRDVTSTDLEADTDVDSNPFLIFLMENIAHMKSWVTT